MLGAGLRGAGGRSAAGRSDRRWLRPQKALQELLLLFYADSVVGVVRAGFFLIELRGICQAKIARRMHGWRGGRKLHLRLCLKRLRSFRSVVRRDLAVEGFG